MQEAAIIERGNGRGDTGSLPAAPARQAGQPVAGQLRDKLYRLRLELAATAGGERQTRLARQAGWHDDLTALPSRAHFRLRLGHALQAGRPLGVLCLGLNESSHVTAAFGRAAGDELLRIVAARLRHALRANDVIGRIGRLEFACMLPDLADRHAGGKVARRLLDALAAPVRIGSIELAAAASIGLAMFPGDGHAADALLDSADAALFRARRERSGLAFFGQATGR